MIKKISFGSALLVVLLSIDGCSSKSYFEPTNIAGKVYFDSKIGSKIVSVNADGATLENGQFVTKKGLGAFKIESGFRLLGANESTVTAGNDNGDVIVYSTDGKEIAKHNFDSKAVTASSDGKLLALITADNTATIFDINESRIVFKHKNESALTIDAKVAAPYFLGELIIFPTLDGKLQVVDTVAKKIARDVVVSSEKNFNNIIFLDVIEDKLVAATPTKVVSINPKFANFLDADVVNIIFIKNGIYIFTKDGKIILTDTNLRVLKERKFPFARFVGVIYGKYIYAVEKEGYLIATDINLATSNIYKFEAPFYGLSSRFDGYLYTSGDSIFYDDKQFKLAK